MTECSVNLRLGELAAAVLVALSVLTRIAIPSLGEDDGPP
jgi:hypothetical protein